MNEFVSRFCSYYRERNLNRVALNSIGKGVINLIDVGSAGCLPHPWLEHADKIKRLLKFEPRGRPQWNSYIRTLNVALGSRNCRRPLYIYKGFNGTGSSFFEQNYAYVERNFEELSKRGPKRLARTWFKRSQLERVVEVECRSIDSVLSELNQQALYHFLKIDAQGAEFEILEGARDFLTSSCLGLHLELFTIPLYRGIKLLPEITSFLSNFGFEMAKKYAPHGSFDSQNDCLFINKKCPGEFQHTISSIYSP